MKISELYLQREVSIVLQRATAPMDAYQIAKASGMCTPMEAAQALGVLAESGSVEADQHEGDNPLAWTWR